MRLKYSIALNHTWRTFYFFNALLAFSVALLPSGGVGGINVKLVLFSLSFLSLFLVISFKKADKKTLLILLSGFIFASIFGIWYLIGILDGNLYAGSQYFGFITTILTLTLFLLQLRSESGSRKMIDFIAFGNIVYSILKILITLLLFLNIIDFSSALSIYKVFNTEPVTLLIAPGLVRFQTIIDILSPFVIIYLYKSTIKFKYFYVFIVGLSILLSYSRLIIILTVILFILSNIRSILTNTNFSLKRLVGIFLVLMISTVSIIFISPYISQRFSNTISSSSDQIRNEQYFYLMQLFDKSPLVGSGFGAYSTHYIRDADQPYTYELQWLALLMQTGVIGIFIISVLILTIGFLALKRRNLEWYIIYSLWISVAFTNPYLISSTSAGVFAFIILMARNSQGDRNKNDQLY